MSITAIDVPSVTKTREVSVSVSLSDFKPEDIAEHLMSLGYQVDGSFSRSVLEAVKGERLKSKKTGSYYDDEDEEDTPEYADGVFILSSELDKLETLTLCGQQDSAHAGLLEIVRRESGRRI
jgi:hypothetical protein